MWMLCPVADVEFRVDVLQQVYLGAPTDHQIPVS